MESVQFHATGMPSPGILITEAVRGEGGYLTNSEGERFLSRYVPNKMELGPRDIISRAMITEFEAGRGMRGQYGDYMNLDVRHLGEGVIDSKLPAGRKGVTHGTPNPVIVSANVQSAEVEEVAPVAVVAAAVPAPTKAKKTEKQNKK